MSSASTPSLPWLQLALDEQDAVDVHTQVNAAAGRVDVLVGEGLRAAIQPDPDADAVAFHGAIAIDPAATTEQKDALLDRLGSVDLDIEFAVVNSDWLAFRRTLPPRAIETPAALGESFRAFLVESLDTLKGADSEGIL